MIVITARSQPDARRLAALFAASVGFFAVVAAAVYGALWVIDNEREGGAHVAEVAPQVDLALPDGMIAVQQVADEGEFRSLAGFTPFIPRRLPETTENTAVLAVTLPDAEGRRAGHILFDARQGVSTDGITGPIVVLIQKPGTIVEGADELAELRPMSASAGRGLVATIQCGGLVMDVQLFYSPLPAEGETAITPAMREQGDAFMSSLREECD
jgi:hypothetical protein